MESECYKKYYALLIFYVKFWGTAFFSLGELIDVFTILFVLPHYAKIQCLYSFINLKILLKGFYEGPEGL